MRDDSDETGLRRRLGRSQLEREQAHWILFLSCFEYRTRIVLSHKMFLLAKYDNMISA